MCDFTDNFYMAIEDLLVLKKRYDEWLVELQFDTELFLASSISFYIIWLDSKFLIQSSNTHFGAENVLWTRDKTILHIVCYRLYTSARLRLWAQPVVFRFGMGVVVYVIFDHGRFRKNHVRLTFILKCFTNNWEVTVNTWIENKIVMR